MSPNTPFFLVNAFTLPSSSHSGNQAAIVLLEPNHPRSADDEWKLLTARDFNYAETAYLTPSEGGGEGHWGLRWWTPTVEVTLCGHATLAAATVLFQLHPSIDRLRFTTRWSGDLIATREPAAGGSEGSAVAITLPGLAQDTVDLIPSNEAGSSGPKSKAGKVRQILLEAAPELNVDGEIVKNVFVFEWGGTDSCIIELDERVDLAKAEFDPKKMLEIGKGLLIVTQAITSSSTHGRLRIHSRIFVPGCGVDEDPVTGSAHAYLTSYYTSPSILNNLPSHLTSSLSSQQLILDAYQLSERGGQLTCQLVEDQRARIVGTATIWGQGKLSD